MFSSSGIVKKKNNYGTIYTVKQLSVGPLVSSMWPCSWGSLWNQLLMGWLASPSANGEASRSV